MEYFAGDVDCAVGRALGRVLSGAGFRRERSCVARVNRGRSVSQMMMRELYCNLT